MRKLVAQGYTIDEAQFVMHVTAVAESDKASALATGVCKCGGRLARYTDVVECLANCGFIANDNAAA